VAVWDESVVAIHPDTGEELVRVPRTRNGDWLGWFHPTASGRLFATVAPSVEVVEVDPLTLSLKPRKGVSTQPRYTPASVTPDGKTLAVPWGYSVRLHDAATGKSLHPDLDGQPTTSADFLEFTTDGRIISAGADGIRVWDPTTGKCLATMRENGKPYRSEVPAVYGSPGAPSRARLTLSLDGKWLAWVERDGQSRFVVWDTATGDVSYREKDGADLIGFDPNGRLWVFHRLSGEILCLEIPSGRVVEKVAGLPYTLCARLSPDGRRLAVSGRTLAVRDVDPKAEWQVIERRPGGQEPISLQWLEGNACPRLIDFTPDGRRLVAQGDTGELIVWDLTGQPTLLARQPDPDYHWLASPGGSISSDGRYLIRSGNRFKGWPGLRILETATLQEAFRLDPPKGWARCALSPDGRRLVLAHWDTTFSVWDWEALCARGRNAAGVPPATPDVLWTRLAHPHPKVGLAAVDALVADPATAVALLKERHRTADPARVKVLVANLGSPDFGTREKAERELLALGAEAAGPVGEALNSPSPEVSARARRIQGKLKPASPVRQIRAVEVLERIGSPEAKDILTDWAKADSTLGAEAKAALRRLAKPRP
jgi:WD40 repeat protein